MTQNAVWGPPMWRVLHGLAEHVGGNQNALVAADEARTVVQMLKAVEGVMPCPMCRQHYHHLKLMYSPERLGEHRGMTLRTELRRWLWELHNNVNRSRGVSLWPPLETVAASFAEEVYSRDALQRDLETLARVMSQATQTGSLSPNHVRIWKATVSLLRRLTGF